MSKKQVDISQKVMEQIHERKIKIKPRAYFILGSILMFASLVLTVIGSVFLVSLTRFVLRTHGPMGQYRLELLLSTFPWWAPLMAILGIVVSIRLLMKYDFSYRHNFRLLIAGLIMAVIVAVMVIEYFQLDDAWFKRGPMRGIIRQYSQDSTLPLEHPQNYMKRNKGVGNR